VRQGRAADDVEGAAYAVALAREHQRTHITSPGLAVNLSVTAAISVAFVGLALVALTESNVARAILAGVLAACMVFAGWQGAQQHRNADKAEHANLELLRRAGKPYVAGGGPASVTVPPIAALLSAGISFWIAFVLAGAVGLLLFTEPFSLGSLARVGLPGAVGSLIGARFASARRRDRIAELYGASVSASASS
jgi:hypothetical protein